MFFCLCAFGLFNAFQSIANDTLFVNRLPKKLKDEMNYYNLTVQKGKNRIKNYYLGFDFASLEKIKLVNRSDNYIYEFYSRDSLVQQLATPGEISFVFLTKKEKYVWRDTLTYSESKTTKKIDLNEAYRGYKYLNPIKITIKIEGNQISEDVNYRRLETSLLLFVQNRLVSIIPSIDLIVIKKGDLLNK